MYSIYRFSSYSPKDYIASPFHSLVSSLVLLSLTNITPTKLKGKRPASTKIEPIQPIISLKLRRRPTISKAKNSKSIKTTIKVVDETIKDKKDTKEAPKDKATRKK